MTPKVGQLVIPNEQYIEFNTTIVESFPNLRSGKEYEILAIASLDEDFPDVWGITKLRCLETNEIYDLKDAPALEEYWALITEEDSIRVTDMVE